VAGDAAYVGASIGPTGRFVEPVGDLSFDAMSGIFREQAESLVAAGADLITLETFLDIKEIRAAIIAIREVAPAIPVIAMLTFDDNGRSVLGTPPESAAITLEAAGADIIGSNCGLGVDGIYEILSAMRRVTGLPLIAQANAGLPLLRDGVTVFPASPEEMTFYHDRFLELGLRHDASPYPCHARCPVRQGPAMEPCQSLCRGYLSRRPDRLHCNRRGKPAGRDRRADQSHR
jgi:5-methyltetrahydrofolate--homocysteine methyltransferase